MQQSVLLSPAPVFAANAAKPRGKSPTPWCASSGAVARRERGEKKEEKEKLTSLTPGTDSTVRAAWFPT